MATAGRRKDAALIERLKARAFEFQFAQAVRVLERIASTSANGAAATGHAAPTVRPSDGWKSVGLDASPRDEIVRFRAHQSLNFPPGEIAKVLERRVQAEHHKAATTQDTIVFDTELDGAEAPPDGVEIKDGDGARRGEHDGDGSARSAVEMLDQAYDMIVTCFGLTGPSGVLPHHYTQMMLRQLRNREEAMRDFFDLFNHRLTSLFYRAIEKHNYPLAFERARRTEGAGDDMLTQMLFSLIGMGTSDLRARLSVRDENLLFFAGHFSRSPRSALALEQIIREYFRVDCRVLQFQGQWLRLSASDRSAMPTRHNPEGRNAQIGLSTIMGAAAWDVQSRFRVQIGPLSLDRFVEFTPARPSLRELCELIRLYVGMEFDFDVQPILRREDIPQSSMGGEPATGARLGWTTWMKTQPVMEDFFGAVFSLDDV